jgi:hypothetical protein
MQEELFDPEDKGTIVLCNIRNYLPSDAASCPRRLESSATPLSEPRSPQSEMLYSYSNVIHVATPAALL